MLYTMQHASTLILADGLGPGGYWAILVVFAAFCVMALLLIVGLVALVVWLIRCHGRSAR